jgi:hypothetical protein
MKPGCVKVDVAILSLLRWRTRREPGRDADGLAGPVPAGQRIGGTAGSGVLCSLQSCRVADTRR